MSNVVPIAKSSDHTNPTNYRTIPLLFVLSKVARLEQHIYGQIAVRLETKHQFQKYFRTERRVRNELPIQRERGFKGGERDRHRSETADQKEASFVEIPAF
jgi:hypothetical protein